MTIRITVYMVSSEVRGKVRVRVNKGRGAVKEGGQEI